MNCYTVYMSERSTKKQKELLDFIASFIAEHGYGPSYREVMRGLGYKSVSTVAVHVDGLIAKGYLRKTDKSARSLEVVGAGSDPSVSAGARVSPAKQKWMVDAVNARFVEYEKSKSKNTLDELYVLIGAMKILGLEGAYQAARSRLGRL